MAFQCSALGLLVYIESLFTAKATSGLVQCMTYIMLSIALANSSCAIALPVFSINL
jgi:hypothetical protein